MTQAAHLVLACNLGVFTSEERARHAGLMKDLFQARAATRELPDGSAVCFAGDDTTWLELAEYVRLERRCCPFFTFTLIRESGDDASWLHITGREGVKTFLLAQLGAPGVP